nr:hypothetical protein Iba_chr12eCG10630 [Ipomoea batatas]
MMMMMSSRCTCCKALMKLWALASSAALVISASVAALPSPPFPYAMLARIVIANMEAAALLALLESGANELDWEIAIAAIVKAKNTCKHAFIDQDAKNWKDCTVNYSRNESFSEPTTPTSASEVFSETPSPVGTPNETENEWRLLFPIPDEPRLIERKEDDAF